MYHTYTDSVDPYSVQTILSTKGIWDKNYKIFRDGEFIDLDNNKYTDAAYIKYLFDIKNERLIGVIDHFNKSIETKNLSNIYSYL